MAFSPWVTVRDCWYAREDIRNEAKHDAAGSRDLVALEVDYSNLEGGAADQRREEVGSKMRPGKVLLGKERCRCTAAGAWSSFARSQLRTQS